MSPDSAHTVTELCDALQRYAGWLDRERPSILVRADVAALAVALDRRADARPLLEALAANVERLPSGAVRKMLRATVIQVRDALGASR